jgi:ElaB/YqjD/DUF883 family membrane-anchored ribosome-binding protein
MERQTQAHFEGNGASGKNRATDDPDEIQEDIHRTRERIDETLDAIKHQLSPGDLVSQLMNMFKSDGGAMTGKAGDLLSSLARTVKENPVPVALIGIGLLGLAKDGGSSKTQTRSFGERETGDGRVREAAEQVGEKLQDKVGDVREQVEEKVGDVREKVQEKAADARETLERGYEKVRQRIEDDPIVLGALGIALGAALGAGLPATRLEDQTFGEKRDELASKAKQMGKQVGEQIREGARKVKDETMQALEG